MGTVATLPRPAELADLAHQRLEAVLQADADPDNTLDDLLRRLFNPDHRELLTYSAFGSAL